jgi:hypothetical protein
LKKPDVIIKSFGEENQINRADCFMMLNRALSTY